MSRSEEIQVVEYVGKQDLTIWLEDNNDDDNPCVSPVWPDRYPDRLAVYVELHTGEIGVALSRDAMWDARAHDRLWFCNIPQAAFVLNTTAESSWFERSTDGIHSS